MLLDRAIIVDARPQIVAHVESAERLSNSLGDQSDLYSITYFDFTKRSSIEFSTSGRKISVDLDKDPIPLTSACGFLATSKSTRIAITDLQEQLAKRLPWFADLDCLELPQEEVTTEELQRAILLLLMSERRRLFARNVSLSSRAATARRQFEQAQRTLTEMAQCLRLAAPDNVITALEYLPVKGQKSVVEGKSFGEITYVQRLPASLRGLAAIHLFADKIETTTASHIEVKLQSAEDKFTHAFWSVDFRALRDDTICLVLPRALDTLELNPVLYLTGERGTLQAVRLGAPHPDPAYCCTIEGGSALEAPLAMRIRTGMPGRSVPREPAAFLPVAKKTTGEQEPKARTELVSALHSIGSLPARCGDSATLELDPTSLSQSINFLHRNLELILVSCTTGQRSPPSWCTHLLASRQLPACLACSEGRFST